MYRTIIYNILSAYNKTETKNIKKLVRNYKFPVRLSLKNKTSIINTVYDIIKYKLFINHIITGISLINKTSYKIRKKVNIILSIGILEILVKKKKEYAVVNELVKLSKIKISYKTSKFINFFLNEVIRKKNIILQRIPSLPEKRLSIKYSVPQWILNIILERKFSIYNTIRLLKSYNRPAQIFFRINNFMTDAEKLKNDLEKSGITTDDTNIPYCLKLIKTEKRFDKTSSYSKGEFYIQNISSQLIGFLIKPEDNDEILDLCSSPGGKLTGYININRNINRVVGVDILRDISNLKMNLKRLNLPKVFFITSDIKRLHLKKQFDKVILDAPCLGLGILGKFPEARYSKKKEYFSKIIELQKELILKASSFVKPGGLLFYTVCSFSKNETEDVVEYFQRNKKNFKLERIESKYLSGMNIVYSQTGLTIIPGKNGYEGFFITKWKCQKRNEKK